MTISIDGKIRGTDLYLKYGQEFPKRYSNRDFYIPSLGNVMVYILEVGQPEWEENFTVKVPIKYYVTQIYDDEHKVQKESKVRKRKSKFYLVE